MCGLHLRVKCQVCNLFQINVQYVHKHSKHYIQNSACSQDFQKGCLMCMHVCAIVKEQEGLGQAPSRDLLENRRSEIDSKAILRQKQSCSSY